MLVDYLTWKRLFNGFLMEIFDQRRTVRLPYYFGNRLAEAVLLCQLAKFTGMAVSDVPLKSMKFAAVAPVPA